MESSISRLLTTGKFLILDLKTKKKVYSENKIMLGKKKQLLTFLKHISASFRSGGLMVGKNVKNVYFWTTDSYQIFFKVKIV